jgi:hypothetical protein
MQLYILVEIFLNENRLSYAIEGISEKYKNKRVFFAV